MMKFKKYYSWIFILLLAYFPILNFLDQKNGFITSCEKGAKRAVYIDDLENKNVKITYENDLVLIGKLNNWYYLIGNQSLNILRDQVWLDTEKVLFLEPPYFSYLKTEVIFRFRKDGFELEVGKSEQKEIYHFGIKKECFAQLREKLFQFNYITYDGFKPN